MAGPPKRPDGTRTAVLDVFGRIHAPVFVAGGSFALLMAVSSRYGWHRDELYFFEAGQRLAWGYVDFPPLVAAAARVSDVLFGSSLVGLRLLPALAVGAVVLVTAQTATDLGGGRAARLVAALGAGLCPVFLGAGHLLSATTFELLAWALVTWILVRLLAGRSARLWLVVGLVVGAGFLAKHSMVFLVAALAGSLVMTGRRRMLMGPWLFGGVAIAALLALPNLAWQAGHDWPVFDMLSSLRDESESVDSLLFVPAQLGMTGLTVIVWVPGFLWLLRSPDADRWRPLAVGYLLLVGLFVVTSGKPYYLVGMYPALLAAGGVWWERRGPIALPVGVVAAGALAVTMAVPVLPPERSADIPVEDLELEFGAQLGWERLVEHVEAAYASLEGDDAVVVTSNYGQAGAVDRFGPSRGLPKAYSRHNNYWLWGPPEGAGDQAVLVGFSRDQVEAWFEDCALTWTFRTPHGVASEEEGNPLWACSGQRRSWDDLWPELKAYAA